MHRSGLSVLGLAVLVVLAGCSGLFGSPTPTDSTPPKNASSSESSSQALENATLWLDGTVERIENKTLYIDDQQFGTVVIPILVRDYSRTFSCHATNDSGLDCGPGQLADVQQGEEVCAFVSVKNGTVQAGKVFFNAICGGPQAPPE